MEDQFTLSIDFPATVVKGRLQLDRNASFEECLNRFFTTEILSGDNKYLCPSCKKKCNAKK